jgi:hypothetical protein
MHIKKKPEIGSYFRNRENIIIIITKTTFRF